MIVIIKECNNGVYKRELRIFKRRGIKYFLFRLFNLNKKIEVIKEGDKKHDRTSIRRIKNSKT